MKKLIIILTVLFTWVMLTPSCDLVEEPYLEPVGTVSPGPNPTDTVRKVLLEDFTGHKCPNCPPAATLAHDLQAIHQGQLVLLTVHAGFFSIPDASGDFTTDLRTPEGTEIHNHYPFSSYPWGLVNRAEFKGNKMLGSSDWQEAVDSALVKPIYAAIDLSITYNEATRELSCTAETEFFTSLSGDYNLCVFITESGIVAPQKDDEQGVIMDYVHNHVLRASMNGTWGEPVGGTGTAIVGGKQSNEYSYVLPEEWVADNCAIVAFVYDTDTEEVLQAEEEELEL